MLVRSVQSQSAITAASFVEMNETIGNFCPMEPIQAPVSNINIQYQSLEYLG